MSKSKMNPKTILPLFDDFLFQRDMDFRAIVIGGGALSIMEIISRATVDFDVLDPNIPKEILSLSDEFAKLMRAEGILLERDWLNNGPIELRGHLPLGWRDRVEKIYEGKSIVFFTLGRSDFLKSKLDACLTRVQPDLNDLLQLKPSRDELIEAKPWLLEQDGGVERETHIDQVYRYIAEKLNYEL